MNTLLKHNVLISSHPDFDLAISGNKLQRYTKYDSQFHSTKIVKLLIQVIFLDLDDGGDNNF